MSYRVLSKGLAATGMSIVALTACGGEAEGEEAEQGNGENEVVAEDLNIAWSAQPPVLDPVATTAITTRDITRNAFEPLVTVDAGGEVQPVLATEWSEEDGGASITFALREDVTFHDGSEMTSADVVASLERWFEVSTIGQDFFQGAQATADDDYTVTITTPEPMYTTMLLMGDPAFPAPIMPAQIAEDAPDEGLDVDQLIGTGPYQFVDWVTDQYVQFEIFEEYVPKDGPDEGLTGDRSGTFASIYFRFVSDDSTRVSGMQSGEYDAANFIPFDNYDQLEADETIDLTIAENGFVGLVFNKAEGLMAEETMRQAVYHAVDVEEVQFAAFANEEFYNLNGGLMSEDSPWYTDAGLDDYGVQDIDRTESLLEEAGYDGELVRIRTTQENPDHYDSAIVVEDQLNAAGINAELVVTDWATVLEDRADPEVYEIFVTDFAPVDLPNRYVFLSPNWPGWTDDPGITGAMESITYAESDEDAYAAMDDLQSSFYEYLPIVKFGEKTTITATSTELEGFENIPGTGDIFYRTSPTD